MSVTGCCLYIGKKKFKAEDDQKSKQRMKEDFLNSIQNILPSEVGEQKKLRIRPKTL